MALVRKRTVSNLTSTEPRWLLVGKHLIKNSVILKSNIV